MKASSFKPSVSSLINDYDYDFNRNIIDWELRPCGMLVQKRHPLHPSSSSSSAMINIKVSYGSHHHDIAVPAQSTFGDLKRALVAETGLKAKEQRLLFRGKEKEDEEFLHMVGVEDMSKVILLEDPASKDRKLKEIQRNNEGILKACEAISIVTTQVDKLSEKVVDLERRVNGGTKVAEKEFVVLIELLMLQLLKLDSIEADGEVKVQRRNEVRRVQSYADTLDNLKARNGNPFSNNTNNKAMCMSVSTKWETFESGFASFNSTVISQNWELFD
ncbi:BAG family molecular chaperone regulator 4-like [Senna tora]|uniref:BAG family molecular chaperone regulator 4-like n=1 Tax=Senna tora TaxID=362788 RepID=A0A835C6R8_9FABA|nr:BAG family molecular chaperone regulator 4-like [Senna tora]